MLSPIRHIVVPTDFSDCAKAAVARAASLARLDGATIHLVHALGVPVVPAPYDVSMPGSVLGAVRRGAEESLDAARKALEAEGVETVTAFVAEGAEPARAVRELADSCDADLVVIGTHGYSGLKHAVLGSVAERTIRTVDRPVLAVKGDAASAAEPWRRILVAVDFSAHADAAVEAAAELASRLGTGLDVVHALELPSAVVPYAWSASFGVDLEERLRESASQRLAEIEARLAERGLSPTIHVSPGRPADVVPAIAEEMGCDLVVMGTRGNTGLQHLLLGSVAERTLRHAPCSVLVVTAEEEG
jgi:nucleotide-binding universal stress UspA family protein